MSDYRERIREAVVEVFATKLPDPKAVVYTMAERIERALRAAGLRVATSTSTDYGDPHAWAERTALRAGIEELEKPND